MYINIVAFFMTMQLLFELDSDLYGQTVFLNFQHMHFSTYVFLPFDLGGKYYKIEI